MGLELLFFLNFLKVNVLYSMTSSFAKCRALSRKKQDISLSLSLLLKLQDDCVYMRLLVGVYVSVSLRVFASCSALHESLHVCECIHIALCKSHPLLFKCLVCVFLFTFGVIFTTLNVLQG